MTPSPFAHSLTPPPLHGYRGEVTPTPLERPRGLTVAVSREAGARGGSIALRVGRLLGWQVFDQEMLGFLTQDENARRDLLTDVPPDAIVWANHRLSKLPRPPKGDLIELVRLVFILAARGEAVIVGRGAGVLLPADTTLNVRIAAPLPERVAYMSQWLRMTTDEAAAEVAARDRVRGELHRSLADREPGDATQYDLVLNSGRLGEAACGDLIVQALTVKRRAARPADPPVDPV